MIEPDIKERWDTPNTVNRPEEGNMTLSWTGNGAKKKRVIQEVMHDDINSKEIA